MANTDRLQMIQAIIARLAGNSGALKGFTVPVVTALLGVAIDKNSDGFVWLGISRSWSSASSMRTTWP